MTIQTVHLGLAHLDDKCPPVDDVHIVSNSSANKLDNESLLPCEACKLFEDQQPEATEAVMQPLSRVQSRPVSQLPINNIM